MPGIFARKPRAGTSPEAVTAALNPATAPNAKAARDQRFLFAAIASLLILVSGYWIFNRSQRDQGSGAGETGMKTMIKAGDMVNRNVNQGEWIARSESELNDMRARLTLLEKTSSSANSATSAEAQKLRQELERDRADGRRVIGAYEEENKRLRRQLEQGSPAAAPASARERPPLPPGAAADGRVDPFRVQGAPAAPASGRSSAAGAAMAPGIGQVQTVSFMAEVKGGAGAGPQGFQGRAPEAPPTAIEASADYLPPNSYAPATVIVGVDASTGVSSQTDPLPVLLRITGPARSVVSNGRLLTTRIDGCVINGAARGDLSSEKVYVKLVRMTCDQPGGRVAVSEVKGFISFAGKTGVRGRVVSREGDFVSKAFLAGIAGGFGRAFSVNTQAALRPTTVVTGESGGSSVPTLTPQQILAGGLGEGIATSGDMLSRYLIERAEQYQPVVEMPTGIEVHVVFLDGVYVRGGRP